MNAALPPRLPPPRFRGGVLRALLLVALAGPALSASRAAPAPRETVWYRVDAARSELLVRTTSGGVLRAFGHDHTVAVRDFAGEVRLTPGSIAPASLEMTIPAASLRVVDRVKESTRARIERDMHEKVLESARYPTIRFRSTRVEPGPVGPGGGTVAIVGELTLHGVTREVRLDARVELAGDGLRARGELPLRQTDYGIRPFVVAGGTVRVRDQVRLTFDIAAVRS